MSVEIRNTSIKLVIPVGTGIVPEQYIVERGKPIDPAVYGLAHREPEVLQNIIGQLRTQAEILNNGERRFVKHLADSLRSAITAIGNSEEA